MVAPYNEQTVGTAIWDVLSAYDGRRITAEVKQWVVHRALQAMERTLEDRPHCPRHPGIIPWLLKVRVAGTRYAQDEDWLGDGFDHLRVVCGFPGCGWWRPAQEKELTDA